MKNSYMLKLSKFLGVPENVEFKLQKDGVDFSNWSYKIQNNILLVKNKVEGSWYQSRVGINKIIRAKIVVTPKEILTDKEKAYLKAVIAPVKDKVKWIIKTAFLLKKEGDREKKLYACIIVKIGNYSDIFLYTFEADTEYKGMELDKEYTLEELGLE